MALLSAFRARLLGAVLAVWCCGCTTGTLRTGGPLCDRAPMPEGGVPIHGLMITKDDGPIFNEWLITHMPYLDALAVLEGSEKDHTTIAAIEMYKQACAERGKKIYFMSEAVPSIRNMIQINTDQRLRTFPLQFLRVHHKTVEERHWVMLLHPDEYLYHDPRLVAAAAQADGADHVLWAALQLLPHPSERHLSDHPSLPQRFRQFYHNYEKTRIPLLEARLFRDGADVQFGFEHLTVLPKEGLEAPWQNLGVDNWRDTVLSRYVRKEGPPALPVYLHYKTPVVDPSMYTRTDFPSLLEPGTNYTWWLRNGRFQSVVPMNAAAVEEEVLGAAVEGEGMESTGGNGTINGWRSAGVGVQHDLSSEDGFYVTDMSDQHFFSSDRFDGDLAHFQWCLPREFQLDRDWGLEDEEDQEEEAGAVDQAVEQPHVRTREALMKERHASRLPLVSARRKERAAQQEEL